MCIKQDAAASIVGWTLISSYSITQLSQLPGNWVVAMLPQTNICVVIQLKLKIHIISCHDLFETELLSPCHRHLQTGTFKTNHIKMHIVSRNAFWIRPIEVLGDYLIYLMTPMPLLSFCCNFWKPRDGQRSRHLYA